jgi:hypothetical protein
VSSSLSAILLYLLRPVYGTFGPCSSLFRSVQKSVVLADYQLRRPGRLALVKGEGRVRDDFRPH